MAADRFETPNQNTAGTNPSEVAPHLSEVPYDNTSLQEAIDNAELRDNVDTGQLQEVQTGTYWSDRPPAREVTALLEGQQPALPDHAPTTEAATASTYQPRETLSTSPEKKSKKRSAVIIGALGALGASAAAAIALFSGPKGGDNAGATTPEASRPVATAPAVAGAPKAQETSTPAPTETVAGGDTTQPVLDAFMSDADKVKVLQIKSGLPLDTLGRQLAGRKASWNTAGKHEATPEYYVSAGFGANQQKDYGKQLSGKQTPFYAEALFGKDWEAKAAKNYEVKAFIDNQSAVDAEDIAYNVITANDPVKYIYSESVEKVEQLSGNTTEGVLRVTSTMHDNLNQTRLAQLGATSADGARSTTDYTYHTESGVIILDNAVVANIK